MFVMVQGVEELVWLADVELDQRHVTVLVGYDRMVSVQVFRQDHMIYRSTRYPYSNQLARQSVLLNVEQVLGLEGVPAEEIKRVLREIRRNENVLYQIVTRPNIHIKAERIRLRQV